MDSANYSPMVSSCRHLCPSFAGNDPFGTHRNPNSLPGDVANAAVPNGGSPPPRVVMGQFSLFSSQLVPFWDPGQTTVPSCGSDSASPATQRQSGSAPPLQPSGHAHPPQAPPLAAPPSSPSGSTPSRGSFAIRPRERRVSPDPRALCGSPAGPRRLDAGPRRAAPGARRPGSRSPRGAAAPRLASARRLRHRHLPLPAHTPGAVPLGLGPPPVGGRGALRAVSRGHRRAFLACPLRSRSRGGDRDRDRRGRAARPERAPTGWTRGHPGTAPLPDASEESGGRARPRPARPPTCPPAAAPRGCRAAHGDPLSPPTPGAGGAGRASPRSPRDPARRPVYASARRAPGGPRVLKLRQTPWSPSGAAGNLRPRPASFSL